MCLTNLKKTFLILLSFFAIVGCGDFKPETKSKEQNIKLAISQINVNGQILIPFPAQISSQILNPSEKTSVFEFSPTKNELTKSNIQFPKKFIGLTLCNEIYYIATTQSIATIKTIKNGLESQVYLPTPKGDFVAACFTRNNKVTVITTTENILNFWTWEDDLKWKSEKLITCENSKTPITACTSVITATNSYVFWGKNNIVYYTDLNAEILSIKEMPFNELSNVCFWSKEESIYISGFNNKFELLHYELKNLNTNNMTSIKMDLGAYPPFNAPFKSIALLPIQVGQELRGFIYGSIDDKPIFIANDKKEFPTAIVTENEQKIQLRYFANLGMLIGVIFLFSFLAYKISTAWEQRLAKIPLPLESIFFGPTLHRGMAFLIDILIIGLVTLILCLWLPANQNLYQEMMDSLSVDNDNITLKKQLPFLIISYLVGLIYGTLTEYYFASTFGKYCLGLKVFSDKDLTKISFLQAFSRNIIPKFSSNIYIILFSNISITISKKKKSLHDYVGNTVVLYSRLHEKLNLNINSKKR